MSEGREATKVGRLSHFLIDNYDPKTGKSRTTTRNSGISDDDKIYLRKMAEGGGSWQPQGSSLALRVLCAVFVDGERREYVVPVEDIKRASELYLGTALLASET